MSRYHWTGIQRARLKSWVTLGSSSDLSEPQYHHLQNRANLFSFVVLSTYWAGHSARKFKSSPPLCEVVTIGPISQ